MRFHATNAANDSDTETLENENNLQTGDSTDNDEDAAPKNDRLAQTIQKINQNRESLTVSMEKNAEKMRNRHNHARKTVVTYTVDYLVSVHVSAIDRSGSDVTRLPASQNNTNKKNEQRTRAVSVAC